jgi:replicative DNA helicase
MESIGEPVLPRLLADDLTPEALGGLLARHGSIAVIAAESAFLDNLSGRYSENGANLHLICAAYAGEATMIDRRNRDPEVIDRPLVAIALAVQPHVLGALIAHPIARAQGLISRFAFSMPTSQLGRRNIDPPKASAETHLRWAECVRQVADRTDRNPDSGNSVGIVSMSLVTSLRLSLSLSSREQLRALRAEQEPRLADTGDLRPVADWIGRHAGRVARIAALLHLAEAAQGEISGQTMSAALEIGDYLLAHGTAALTGPDEKVRRALEWLTARAQAMVSVRELHRGPLAGRGTTEDATGLAERLVQHGALRAIPSTHTGPGRPPSPTYEVHPDIMRHADRTDRTGAEVIPLDAVVSEIAELPEPQAERAWSALEAAGAR